MMIWTIFIPIICITQQLRIISGCPSVQELDCSIRLSLMPMRIRHRYFFNVAGSFLPAKIKGLAKRFQRNQFLVFIIIEYVHLHNQISALNLFPRYLFRLHLIHDVLDMILIQKRHLLICLAGSRIPEIQTYNRLHQPGIGVISRLLGNYRQGVIIIGLQCD